MTWVMRWKGQEIVSDDFTLDELGRIEKETGVPWSTLNPLREMKVARSFLSIALERTGGDPADLDGLTLGRIKAVFDFRPDEPFPGDEEADDGPLAQSSDASSPGASGGSTGPRRKRAVSASATSS